MSKWYCACVQVEEAIGKLETVANVTTQHKNIFTNIYPFAVEAQNYYEAVGKANEAMEVIKKIQNTPETKVWLVKVNALGEGGLISDPKNCTVSKT